MMTAPRIFFAMAEDGLFPKAIAKVTQDGCTHGAILLAAVLGVIFILIRTFSQLADQFIIGIWPFYAHCRGRRVRAAQTHRPGKPYHTWGYRCAAPVSGIAVSAGNYLASQTGQFTDIGIILTGVPAYYGERLGGRE
jgi:L-asparagine transporter-like permease